MSDTLPTLRTEGLVKHYGRREVVRGVDLQARGGEVVGLLGPNGAGKTTAFCMVAGLVKPTGGSIHLNDHDLTHLPAYKRARLGVGYLPQEASVFRGLTVAGNIMAVLQLRKDLSRADRKAELAASWANSRSSASGVPEAHTCREANEGASRSPEPSLPVRSSFCSMNPRPA